MDKKGLPVAHLDTPKVQACGPHSGMEPIQLFGQKSKTLDASQWQQGKDIFWHDNGTSRSLSHGSKPNIHTTN